MTSDGLVQPWKEFPILHPFAWDVVRDGTQDEIFQIESTSLSISG